MHRDQTPTPRPGGLRPDRDPREHLWRLSDDIVPLHTHDDRPVLTHRCPDTGRIEVLRDARDAGERVAAQLGPSRRNVLRSLGAIGAMAAISSQPRVAFATNRSASVAAATTSDVLVVLFCRGAQDGLQLLVPKGDADYQAARPTIALKDAELLTADARFGFHPALRPLLPLWTSGGLAAIHAVGNPDANRSHFDAQLDMERAAPVGVRSGWLGRHLSAVSDSTDLVRAVTLGTAATAQARTTFPTAAIASSIDDFQVEAWEGYHSSVVKILDGFNARAGGQVAAQSASLTEAIGSLAPARALKAGTGYPDSELGGGLAQIARLIKGGAPVEAACVDMGGWDMHDAHGEAGEEWGRMRRWAADFATSLAAFRTDLGAAWSRVTVVTMSEFGRRLEENVNGGTDHGHGGLMFVAGGSVNGGKVYGAWPGLSAGALNDGDLEVATDYRHVVSEILTKRLHTPDIGAVFPGFSAKPLGILRA